MYDRVELKMRSKEQLQGKVLMSFLASLIISVISMVLEFIPFFGFFLTFIVVSIATLGLYRIFLGITRGDMPDLAKLIPESDIWFKAIALTFLTALFTFLWSLLLVIPGIVKAYSYSMAPYLLAENPQMTALEALNESKRLMKGHKLDLFVLDLSFIGWSLLVPITCGLISIYLIPYTMTARANFYRLLTDDTNQTQTYSQYCENTTVNSTWE